jgi:uncharacterized protein (DUF2461 family)
MDLLLDSLLLEFGPGKVFRPYRDLRTTSDKSPYKTNIAAMLESGGYIELSSGGLSVGSGMHVMSSSQLARYRRAVAAEGCPRHVPSIAPRCGWRLGDHAKAA